MSSSTKDIPKINPFKPITFPDYHSFKLKNGIPVIELSSKAYEVLKLEISFEAGRYFEKNNAVARACANQLKEGTKSKNSETIAKEIDYFGASLNISAGMDFARVELYTLRKHLKKMLPLVADILQNPLFSERELNNYKQRGIQRLQIDLAKNNVIAYRSLTEAIFGEKHPYGYNSSVNTIKSLDTDMLKDHFDNNFNLSGCSIIIAGATDNEVHQLLDQYLGELPIKKNIKNPNWQILPGESKHILVESKQKFQSSIRLGRRLFNRTHPDYPGVYVLNTLLGGFFGSRLMKNIREDKGLTYDIFSTIDMFWKDGYFMIGADVSNENISQLIDEIHKELSLLKNRLVDADELQLVKNYIKGNLLNLLNGPFNSIELLRLVAVYGQNASFFNDLVHKIDTIDDATILALSNKYFIREAFFEVVVGN